VIYFRFRSCAPFTCAAGRLLGRGTPVIGEHNTWSSAYLKQSGYSSVINALSRWSQLITARSSHRIRTSTQHLKEVLVAHGIDEQRIFVAGMGADLDLFRPRPREESCARVGLDPSFRYVGYAGSLNRWQGVDVMVESLRLLVDAFPEVRAVILGDGPQAENLRQQAFRAGLDGHLVFKGTVPHEEMNGWITCFDVGIGALRTQARGRMLGSPMKLVEYAACGVPAVTASVEGVEVLQQRGAILLVPPDNPSAAAEAIARLLRDPALRGRMGQTARKVAEESLSWTAIGREILSHIPHQAGP
jgi:glycosyltransferase involved in cell wall biosynthesis